jgi:endonuclease YncB( thermonuclease family)
VVVLEPRAPTFSPSSPRPPKAEVLLSLHRRAAAVLLVLAAVIPSTPSTASSGGLHHWYGRAVNVIDGDTVDVAIDGWGQEPVRMLTIQAMEMSINYLNLGDCHGKEAKIKLERLVEGRRVRLSALHADSRGQGRPLRYIEFQRHGRWIDAGYKLIRGGHALWFPKANEYVRNLEYHRAADRAARHHLGLFNPTFCGRGPAQDARLTMSLRYTGPGTADGEWMRINNHSARGVSLAGWYVRDSALRRHTFPRGARVGAGSSVYVHPRYGTNTERHFYWDLGSAVFENPTGAPEHMGDGGYLFDPDGDLRAHRTYPCVIDC